MPFDQQPRTGPRGGPVISRAAFLRGMGVAGAALVSATTLEAMAPALASSARGLAGDPRAAATTSTAELLGAPLHSVTTLGGAYPVTAAGQFACTVVSGTPAVFYAVDPLTGERRVAIPTNGAGGAWGLTGGHDGRVYFATYSWRQGPHLYRWTPGAQQLEDLGAPPPAGDLFTWGIAADSRSVYGGGTPSGHLWRWDYATRRFTDLGQVATGEQYVRSVAAAGGKVYAGLGAKARLFEVDPLTRAKREITLFGPAPGHPADAFVYDLTAAGRFLFVRLAPSGDLFVHDLTARAWLRGFADPAVAPLTTGRIVAAEGLGVSPPDPRGRVFFVRRNALWQIDASARWVRQTRASGVPMARRFGWAYSTEAGFAGQNLTSITAAGQVWLYNLASGNFRLRQADIDAQVAQVESVGTGPAGDVHLAGYFQGGFATLDVAAGTLDEVDSYTFRPGVPGMDQVKGLGQVEGMHVVGDRLVLGVYPFARVLGWRPSVPWANGGNPAPTQLDPEADTNPIELVSQLSSQQDRPYGIAEDGGRLVVVSYPYYGQSLGALSVVEADGTWTAYRTLLPAGELFNTVTASGGVAYAGSTRGRVVAFDLASRTTRWTALTPDGAAVLGLGVDAGGAVWGLTASATIVKVDTAAHRVIAVARPVSPTATTAARRAAAEVARRDAIDTAMAGGGSAAPLAGTAAAATSTPAAAGPSATPMLLRDGDLYGIGYGQVFRTNLTSLATEILAVGAHRFTIGGDGNLYFTDNTTLYRVALGAGP